MKNEPVSRSRRRRSPADAAFVGEKPSHFFQKQLADEEPLTFTTAEQLYRLSKLIITLEPWSFLGDQEIFLLRDSASSELCHCSVMGSLGEVLSLHVYIGAESYRFFKRISSGEPVTPEDFLAQQKGVSLEFVPLKEQTPPDRELLKCFGHPTQRGLRGPIFRALRPGFHPWYVTESEGKLLAECMLALLVFCKHFLSHPGHDYWGQEDVYPLLVAVGNPDTEKSYAIETLRVPTPSPVKPQPPVLDELRVRKVLQKDYTCTGCLEADCFFALAMIGEKNERKSCAHVGLVTDAASGFLFKPLLEMPSQSSGEILMNVFLDAVETAGRLPAEVRVSREECAIFLEPLARQLGISVRVVKSLPSLERAKSALLTMMSES